MKTIWALFLTLILLLPSVLQLGVMGWFEINRSRIVSELCVNRNRPQLHCNGKCYLKQQLKKTEERKQKQILRWHQQEWNCMEIQAVALPPTPFNTEEVTYPQPAGKFPEAVMPFMESPPPEQRNA